MPDWYALHLKVTGSHHRTHLSNIYHFALRRITFTHATSDWQYCNKTLEFGIYEWWVSLTWPVVNYDCESSISSKACDNIRMNLFRRQRKITGDRKLVVDGSWCHSIWHRDRFAWWKIITLSNESKLCVPKCVGTAARTSSNPTVVIAMAKRRTFLFQKKALHQLWYFTEVPIAMDFKTKWN